MSAPDLRAELVKLRAYLRSEAAEYALMEAAADISERDQSYFDGKRAALEDAAERVEAILGPMRYPKPPRQSS